MTAFTFKPEALTGEFFHAIIEHMISEPHRREWSLQGFGMLRTYIEPDPDVPTKKIRLHIWDSRYAVPGVSELHTHPWHFDSIIAAGIVHNQRYLKSEIIGDPYMEQEILCGEGGGLCDVEPKTVLLHPQPIEVLTKGQVYRQSAYEIHASRPQDGTVTLVWREFLDDADHAYVYWPAGEQWVTAEPRRATPEEVDDICSNARKLWF